MLFYNNTIHDFDLARWLMRDEVTAVQAYATVAICPEVADYGDIVAGVVNLKYGRGAIGNIESYVQAVYGHDIRTEIAGSKGTILVGSIEHHPVTFLASEGSSQKLADHFLTRFVKDAYVAEMRDFRTKHAAGSRSMGYRGRWAAGTGRSPSPPRALICGPR